ncbi:MAG: polysaccharide biosynthesis tyrosine autokinase [Mariniblastus sp.]|nr:polysaccharide biosynthesis tyrosine autokinase [Mariniblastus sp.]
MNKQSFNQKPGPQPNFQILAKLVLRKWTVLAVACGLVLAALAAAVTIWAWEPSYDAKQFVQIRQNREFIALDESTNKKMDPKRYLAPVTSEPLLRALLTEQAIIQRRPTIQVEDLQKMVRYEPIGGELYAIICRDQDPVLAAVVSELATQELLNGINEDRQNSLEKLRQKIDQKILTAQADVNNLSDKMRDLNERRMLAEPGDPTRADPSGLIRLNRESDMDSSQDEMQKLEITLVQKKLALENTEEEFEAVMIAPIVNGSPILAAIDDQIRKLKEERANVIRLGSGHPTVVNINERLVRAQQNRSGEKATLMESTKDEWIENTKAQLTNDIKSIEMNIERLRSGIQADKSEIALLENEYKENNDLDFAIMQLGWERDRAAENLSYWNTELSNVSGKQLADFDVTLFGPGNSTAVPVPTKPVEQYPYRLLAVICLPAFILPFALAFLWEFKLQRISHPQQVQEQVSSNLLGEVADLPTRYQSASRLSSQKITKQLRLYEESVDNLSAIMMHIADAKPMTFSVTSASSNEGKTTLSSQLAISSSRSHFGRTLLIDADLRSPSLHRLFDLPMQPGLVDALSTDATDSLLGDVICSTQIENLDILTAGKLTSSPRRYFSGPSWRRLLDQLRQKYDYIVIDTPPVLAASESLAISKECDHTLMCVLRDVSVTDSVKRAYERLTAADVNVVGYAFSGVPQYEYAIKYGSYEYNMS